jgi:LmbE family N-acetylglucosaminyl deacetylase
LAFDQLREVSAPEGSRSALPRVLLVFAHPDDEVIAVGGRMGRFANSHFVHITDGAPRNGHDSRAHGFQRLDDYRRARAGEFCAALERAGIASATSECLGIPDQEASLQLAELTRRIAQLIAQHRPEAVFTHPYEGGHPDHDACAFAVHHAANGTPAIIEAPFYNARNRGTGGFLPSTDLPDEVVYELTPGELARKQALLDCFTSQRDTLRGFTAAEERYRVAPAYDFSTPPHQPPVLYDGYPWGMNSARFCDLALEAERELREAERQSQAKRKLPCP